ncbi:perlucin-like protein [Mytilus galloprovincialis]|uniref:perlucin-like protein n=1 Tax=Mytilus galloprovincialis TaxID=29158 RepID=UPI003F7CBEC9
MDSNMCIAFILILGAIDVSNSFPCVSNKTMDELKTFREKLKQFGIEIKNKFSGLDTDLQSMESDIAKRSFEKYNGHCYYFGEDILSWFNAQRKCQLIGGNLVKIDDSSENTWLKSKSNGAGSGIYWIGLSDLVEGEFRWTNDQEVVSYKNFKSGQPNNSGAKEDCVSLYSSDGTWYDKPCTKTYKYICENDLCY